MKHFASLAGILISTIAIITSIVFNVDNTVRISMKTADLQKKMNSFEKLPPLVIGNTTLFLEEEIQKSIASKVTNATLLSNYNAKRIGKIEEEIRNINNVNRAIKEAINPINPKQIIATARLTDLAIENSKKISKIKQDLHSELDIFKALIQKDLEFNNNLNWIVIAALVGLFFASPFNSLVNIFRRKSPNDIELPKKE